MKGWGGGSKLVVGGGPGEQDGHGTRMTAGPIQDLEEQRCHYAHLVVRGHSVV